MSNKIAEQIVTKEQLEIIMTAWKTCARIPKSSETVFVAFPHIKEHAEITRHNKQKDSDCKAAMYKIAFFID